jgi:hypothetical protein
MPSTQFSAMYPTQQGKPLQPWDLEARFGATGRS